MGTSDVKYVVYFCLACTTLPPSLPVAEQCRWVFGNLYVKHKHAAIATSSLVCGLSIFRPRKPPILISPVSIPSMGSAGGTDAEMCFTSASALSLREHVCADEGKHTANPSMSPAPTNLRSKDSSPKKVRYRPARSSCIRILRIRASA